MVALCFQMSGSSYMTGWVGGRGSGGWPVSINLRYQRLHGDVRLTLARLSAIESSHSEMLVLIHDVQT